MTQSVENRLIKAIQKQAEKVVYFCTADNVLPDFAIHEIRKSLKRMRALLKFRIDFPYENSQSITKEIASLGKLLSVARESFVNIQVLDKIIEESESKTAPKLTGIKELMLEKNRRTIWELIENKKVLVEIQSFIYDVEGKLSDWILHPHFEVDVLGQIGSTYSAGYQLFQKIEVKFDQELLHALRKKMKVLWYQIDFAKPGQPIFFKLKSNELRKIAELLGNDHDLFVFQNEIKDASYKLEIFEKEILDKKINHLHNQLFHTLHARLKKFFSDTQEDFKVKLNSSYIKPDS